MTYPQESFSVIEASIEGKPLIGSINMAYKDYRNRTNFPWCLYITIILQSLHENGLPVEEEFSVANKLETELVDDLKKVGVVHYIGHVVYDGQFGIFAYTDKPDALHDWLQKKIQLDDALLPFQYEINKDVDWSMVERFMLS